ncbi:MAG: hypothetical protein LH609_01100 [Rudanella sp.]|nr:hypothetical protein [Rudanella sp.]
MRYVSLLFWLMAFPAMGQTVLNPDYTPPIATPQSAAVKVVTPVGAKPGKPALSTPRTVFWPTPNSAVGQNSRIMLSWGRVATIFVNAGI